MAEDPRRSADTEDIPTALEGFRFDDESRARVGSAITRAATLLTLMKPRSVSASRFIEATEEAREVLEVQPVEPFEIEGTRLADDLSLFGSAGMRAAELSRTKRRVQQEEALGEGEEPWPSVSGISRPARQQIGPIAPSDRNRVAEAQHTAALDLFASDRIRTVRSEREATIQLVAASLLDEDELVQVAAAAATLRMDRRNPLAEAILEDANRLADDEIAELTRAVFATERVSETRRIELEYPFAVAESDADSVIVHGTWARRGKWWHPGNDLHQYLRNDSGLFPGLYEGPSPFAWSGYFSFRAVLHASEDWNRKQAGDSLAWWAHRKLVSWPDIIGHSYGASIAMLATRAEKDLRGLVLLSPAIHRSCLPSPAHYDQILHVRMKLDLVLLADLSTPRLLSRLPNVTERRIPRKGLTGHIKTHDPHVWQESGLTDYVRDQWLPQLAPR